jgi:hypothetical protein
VNICQLSLETLGNQIAHLITLFCLPHSCCTCAFVYTTAVARALLFTLQLAAVALAILLTLLPNLKKPVLKKS